MRQCDDKMGRYNDVLAKSLTDIWCVCLGRVGGEGGEGECVRLLRVCVRVCACGIVHCGSKALVCGGSGAAPEINVPYIEKKRPINLLGKSFCQFRLKYELCN